MVWALRLGSLAAGLGTAIAFTATLSGTSPAQASPNDGFSWLFGGSYSSRNSDRYWDRDRRRRSSPVHSGPIPGVSAPKNVTKPEGPLFYVIALDQQRISVYGDDGLLAKERISSGRQGYETPTGIYSILQRNLHHRSNIYSAAPMPYMQRLTNSGYAIHGGVVPGYPASHGCVRLSYDFAQKLWGMSQGRERVVVSPSDIVPAPFQHAKLPTPRFYPVAGAGNTASSQVLRHAIDMTAASEARTQTVAAQVQPAVQSDAKPNAATPAAAMLNPVDYAKVMRAETAAKVKATESDVQAAKTAFAKRTNEAAAAVVEARKADAALAAAKARLKAAELRVSQAKDEAAVKKLNDDRDAAAAMVKDAEEQANRAAAQRDEAAKAAQAMSQQAKDAETARRDLLEASRLWTRRLEPVSVFVSRKTGRIYIRQNFTKVFEAPVVIKDNDQPIGTHVFMAMQPKPTEADRNPELKWISLTVPQGQPRIVPRGKGKEVEDAPRIAAGSTEAAANALDRIEMTPEVQAMISDTVWTGASLIISDSPPSRETADSGTDFVIFLR